MRVLVIPENFRNDQYILKQLILGLFRTVHKRSVKVKVCQDPLLGGGRRSSEIGPHSGGR